MSVLIVHVILLIRLYEEIILLRWADLIISTPIASIHIEAHEFIVVFLNMLILPNRWDNALIADTNGRGRLLPLAIS